EAQRLGHHRVSRKPSMLAKRHRDRPELLFRRAVELHVTARHAGEMNHLWIPPERNLEVRLHTHLGVRLSDVAATLASPVGALATENRGRDAAVDCHRREQHAAHHGCAPSQTLRGEELLAYA